MLRSIGRNSLLLQKRSLSLSPSSTSNPTPPPPPPPTGKPSKPRKPARQRTLDPVKLINDLYDPLLSTKKNVLSALGLSLPEIRSFQLLGEPIPAPTPAPASASEQEETIDDVTSYVYLPITPLLPRTLPGLRALVWYRHEERWNLEWERMATKILAAAQTQTQEGPGGEGAYERIEEGLKLRRETQQQQVVKGEGGLLPIPYDRREVNLISRRGGGGGGGGKIQEGLVALARRTLITGAPSPPLPSLPHFLPLPSPSHSSSSPPSTPLPTASTLLLPLSPFVFSAPPRLDILHLCVLSTLSHSRSGTANDLSRGEMGYSGSKLRPQKGTGRARLGDAGSPMMHRTGGRAFPRRPRDWGSGKKVMRRVRELGVRVALSDKWRTSSLLIIPNTDITYFPSSSPSLLSHLLRSLPPLPSLPPPSPHTVRPPLPRTLILIHSSSPLPITYPLPHPSDPRYGHDSPLVRPVEPDPGSKEGAGARRLWEAVEQGRGPGGDGLGKVRVKAVGDHQEELTAYEVLRAKRVILTEEAARWLMNWLEPKGKPKAVGVAQGDGDGDGDGEVSETEARQMLEAMQAMEVIEDGELEKAVAAVEAEAEMGEVEAPVELEEGKAAPL